MCDLCQGDFLDMWAPTSGTATTVRLASREREGAARICCVCRRPLSPSWLRHRISSFPRAPSPTLLSRYTKLAAQPASMTCTRQTGQLHFALSACISLRPLFRKLPRSPRLFGLRSAPRVARSWWCQFRILVSLPQLPHFTRAWLTTR